MIAAATLSFFRRPSFHSFFPFPTHSSIASCDVYSSFSKTIGSSTFVLVRKSWINNFTSSHWTDSLPSSRYGKPTIYLSSPQRIIPSQNCYFDAEIDTEGCCWAERCLCVMLTLRNGHSFLRSVVWGSASFNKGSESATPTLDVPTSSPTRVTRRGDIMEWISFNWPFVTIGINHNNLSVCVSLVSVSLSEMRLRSGHVALVAFCMGLIMCGATVSNSSFLKIPVYWKDVNVSQVASVPDRRLHDYLSLFPAYGDTSKLGCVTLRLFLS